MAFDLSNYQPVEERLRQFYDDHPSGRIATELISTSDDMTQWLFKAYVYRTHEDIVPWATGYAHEIQTQKGVNSTSAAENCETSAIGRALGNAGYAPKGARPTREEMAKVERQTRKPVKQDKSPAKHENEAKLAAFEAAGMDKDEAKKLYAQALEACGFDRVESAGQVKVVRQWLTDNMVQTVLDATEVKEET